MSILNRYLLNFFLTGFLKTTGIFVGLFLLIDGIEGIRRFSQKPNFNAVDITLLILSRIPNFISMLIPSLVLLTTLMGISKLVRQNEITVMRASGLSLNRIMIPFLMGGLIIALGHLLILDQITPRTNLIAQKLDDHISDRQIAPVSQSGDRWVRSGQQIIHIEQTDPATDTLHGVTLFTFNAEHRLVSRLEAKTALLNDEGWQLMSGINYQFLPRSAVQTFQN
ncbi:MAG: LptF/LptG family permease, partial [Magnetococcales bacterium]|nr:LptF/LptG family permease [Magnetococcales bacterium]